MFEHGGSGDVAELCDADYDAWVADLIAADPGDASLPFPDAPVSAEVMDEASCLSDEQLDEWVASCIATDPERPDRFGPEAFDSCPVTSELLAQLESVDPVALDDAGRVAVAVAWTRVRNSASARVAETIAAAVHSTPPNTCIDAHVLASGEFGAALRLGRGGADQLVDVAVALTTHLPATLAVLRRGDISWEHAVALAQATAALSPEHARLVEKAVLPHAPRRTLARHRDAIRRAVDRIDPAGAGERRRKAREDISLIRTHHGDGMGELFARMPSEQLDTVWSGADVWARSRKAAGDKRSLDQLRVAALVQWAQSFLHHGDPTYCDRWCDNPSDHAPAAESPTAPPTRHGRAASVHALWDLTSLLGLTRHCGEMQDSGATLPPEAMEELVAGGVAIRRLIVDTATGELIDLTPRTWTLPPRGSSTLPPRGSSTLPPRGSSTPPATSGTAHGAPVVLDLVVDVKTWRQPADGDEAGALAQAVAMAPAAIRQMLAHPLTADDLDATPGAYPAPAALADFVTTRDRHPVNPTAGTTAASAADLDHTVSVRDGGTTTRDNLASLTRRWHRLKTFGGWAVRRVGRHWEWRSPAGRVYTTRPHDYRLGP